MHLSNASTVFEYLLQLPCSPKHLNTLAFILAVAPLNVMVLRIVMLLLYPPPEQWHLPLCPHPLLLLLTPLTIRAAVVSTVKLMLLLRLSSCPCLRCIRGLQCLISVTPLTVKAAVVLTVKSCCCASINCLKVVWDSPFHSAIVTCKVDLIIVTRLQLPVWSVPAPSMAFRLARKMT